MTAVCSEHFTLHDVGMGIDVGINIGIDTYIDIGIVNACHPLTAICFVLMSSYVTSWGVHLVFYS